MKYYTVYIDGKSVSGPAEDIIKELMEQGYFEKFESVEDFLLKSAQNIWRLFQIGVDVGQGTLEERCSKFLDIAIENGLLQVKK